MTSFRFDDPDNYVKGTPYQEFSKLRAEAPFARHLASQHGSGDGFWLATKHSDIVSISRNPQLFATSAPLLADPVPRDLWPAFPGLGMIADNLMTFDAQKHAVFRSLGTGLFSSGKLAEQEIGIRMKCGNILERAFARRQFDFATDVALPVATETILGEFLGIPQPDLPMVTRQILTINAMDDPFFRPRADSLMDAASSLLQYGMNLLRRVNGCPDRTALGVLANHDPLPGITTEQLFLAYWFPLAAGAFDTSASTIAGGIKALLTYPKQLERLQADAGLISSAVEEMIRWVSPVVYFRRTSTANTDFNGQHIKKGEKVILCYASANRDEDVFCRPDDFEVGRFPNNHLSFGYGPHFCLGARLATLVLRVFLEEFVRRTPNIRLNGEVIHTRSTWMNRIRLMPVSNPRVAV